eukprot:TRINITY_DN4816_c0_g1_i1.p1 TRINITY_DN4816_c0_g1~~TRINITY_DN4816_c0_g1_i1.p1  ORF type:complete len:567 (-),score=87.47 TRINITY_DN4816_c0_g1_i1:1388-3088(-)
MSNSLPRSPLKRYRDDDSEHYHKVHKSTPNVVTISDDEDDPELAAAIALSLQPQTLQSAAESLPNDIVGDSASLPLRLQQPTAVAADLPKDSDVLSEIRHMQQQRYQKHVSAGSSADVPNSLPLPRPLPSTRPAQRSSSGPRLQYDGLKYFCNRLEWSSNTAGCLNFSDLIDKATLQRALITSFMVDDKYIRELIPLPVPVTIVQHYNSNTQQAGHYSAGDHTTVVFPPMLPRGNMHAKLGLLVYPGFLRVVITSANFTPEDWLRIGQVTWVQDFPRHADAMAAQQQSISEEGFARTLARVLHAMKLQPDWLKQYDMSAAAAILIPSVPGYHEASMQSLYGHLCLRQHLRRVPDADIGSQTPVYFQASSIGALAYGGRKWLHEFMVSATASAGASTLRQLPDLRIIYPAWTTVRNSRLGADGAGTTILQRKHYEETGFPTSDFYDLKGRDGSLSHSKVLMRRNPNDAQPAWIYVGSGNFSSSAWGRTQKDGKFHVANYELGVLLIAKGKPDQALSSCQLPFTFPPPKYTRDQSPWFNSPFWKNQQQKRLLEPPHTDKLKEYRHDSS